MLPRQFFFVYPPQHLRSGITFPIIRIVAKQGPLAVINGVIKRPLVRVLFLQDNLHVGILPPPRGIAILAEPVGKIKGEVSYLVNSHT
jgi:hypothetical protein